MILPARKEEGEPAVAFLFQEIQIPSENQENQVLFLLFFS